jgi:hypothetical protein
MLPLATRTEDDSPRIRGLHVVQLPGTSQEKRRTLSSVQPLPERFWGEEQFQPAGSRAAD